MFIQNEMYYNPKKKKKKKKIPLIQISLNETSPFSKIVSLSLKKRWLMIYFFRKYLLSKSS